MQVQVAVGNLRLKLHSAAQEIASKPSDYRASGFDCKFVHYIHVSCGLKIVYRKEWCHSLL